MYVEVQLATEPYGFTHPYIDVPEMPDPHLLQP